MADNDLTGLEEESSFEPKQHEVPNPKAQGAWSRIKFDWPTIGIIALIIFSTAGFLWNSIENVDDNLDHLSQRVNQIDDKFDARMERLTEDISFIKGRIAARLSSQYEEPSVPEKKKPRGRTAEKKMPLLILDTPENVARAIMQGPQKKGWDPLKKAAKQ